MQTTNEKAQQVQMLDSEALAIISILRNLKDLMYITSANDTSGNLKKDEEQIMNLFQRNNIQEWEIFKAKK